MPTYDPRLWNGKEYIRGVFGMFGDVGARLPVLRTLPKLSLQLRRAAYQCLSLFPESLLVFDVSQISVPQSFRPALLREMHPILRHS
jgi:hypothetical protein